MASVAASDKDRLQLMPQLLWTLCKLLKNSFLLAKNSPCGNLKSRYGLCDCVMIFEHTITTGGMHSFTLFASKTRLYLFAKKRVKLGSTDERLWGTDHLVKLQKH